MDEEQKKFFDGLAGGESSDDRKGNIIDQEFIDEAEPLEPTLVRSGPSSVALRTGRPRATKQDNATASPDDALFEDTDGQLAIDIYQTPDEIVIQSTIAGVKSEDLDIHITNEAVSIRGVRHQDEDVRDDDYFYQECYWGKFSRSIILPQEIDSDQATAELKNGVLTIRLPKLNRQKTKKLRVKSS